MEHLIARAKAIVLTPASEWRAIEREPHDPTALFTRYVAILAAIPALAHFIGASVIGRYQPILPGLLSMIVGYLLSFAAVYALALIIDALAHRFHAQRNFSQALKLVAYAHTPFWLAGIFLVIPGLSFLVVLGLYGLYLLRLGLPPLMRAPQEHSLLYVIVVGLCAAALAVASGFLQLALFSAG